MSTKIVVSMETIPDYATLAKTADIADKHCIICLKSKLTVLCLSDHYLDTHDIYWCADDTDSLAEWLEFEEHWNGKPPHESSNEVDDKEHSDVEEKITLPQLPSYSPGFQIRALFRQLFIQFIFQPR